MCLYVTCHSETCAILKHVLDWHCPHFVISRTQQYVFLTHCIWSSPTLITKKQTNKQTKAVAWPYFLVSLHNLCFRTLHLARGFDLTKHRAQRLKQGFINLAGGNWQKWKRVFLTCPCHEIYRDEAVGLKSCQNTWKITIFVKMWNLGQYRENLIFCQLLLNWSLNLKNSFAHVWHI